jgi:hypothetical protein
MCLLFSIRNTSLTARQKIINFHATKILLLYLYNYGNEIDESLMGISLGFFERDVHTRKTNGKYHFHVENKNL